MHTRAQSTGHVRVGAILLARPFTRQSLVDVDRPAWADRWTGQAALKHPLLLESYFPCVSIEPAHERPNRIPASH
jgi:hypothetical protein